MELDKAIEVLTANKAIFTLKRDPEYYEALNLGIEALIFAKNVLKLMPVVFQLPVPGETEEQERR